MVRTQISLEEELYKEAQEEARRRGISFSELCQHTLVLALHPPKPERPWMRFSGLIEGDPDASSSVDEVVYDRERP
ncbi:MAG TPA: CopG family transcriptional regulator [Thermoanaerobaculia bacterium]|nr:CopG family transcriptional regulator [Thermoanaerobaculia bacterium]